MCKCAQGGTGGGWVRYDSLLLCVHYTVTPTCQYCQQVSAVGLSRPARKLTRIQHLIVFGHSKCCLNAHQKCALFVIVVKCIFFYKKLIQTFWIKLFKVLYFNRMKRYFYNSLYPSQWKEVNGFLLVRAVGEIKLFIEVISIISYCVTLSRVFFGRPVTAPPHVWKAPVFRRNFISDWQPRVLQKSYATAQLSILRTLKGSF